MAWTLTRYNAFYGTYNKGDIMHYLEGTYSKEKAFKEAQNVANKTGKTVCIREEIKEKKEKIIETKVNFYDVKPEI